MAEGQDYVTHGYRGAEDIAEAKAKLLALYNRSLVAPASVAESSVEFSDGNCRG